MKKPILKVENLQKSFGGNQAVEDVSFEIYPGEVVTLAGDNGAGKSTVVKMISGVYSPDGGRVSFDDQIINNSSTMQIRDLGLETIYQDLALANNLDVGANLFLGRELTFSRFGIPFVDRVTMRKRANEALKELSINLPNPKAPVDTLSGGQRQAIAIARAIYWKARLVIMDEPTAALGVPEQREVTALIKGLRERNVAIMLISHSLPEILGTSDRVSVLAHGRVAGIRAASETSEDEIVRLMMGGTDQVA